MSQDYKASKSGQSKKQTLAIPVRETSLQLMDIASGPKILSFLQFMCTDMNSEKMTNAQHQKNKHFYSQMFCRTR